MASLEGFADLVTECFESGKTPAEISATLLQLGLCQSVPKCQVRRFCMKHQLRRKRHVTDAQLEIAVTSSIDKTGPRLVNS